MPLSNFSKTIALVILTGISANAASAQAVLELLPPAVFDAQNPAVDLSHTANLLNNTPQYTLPDHIQIPRGNAAHRPNNNHAAQALGAVIGLGIVAGAVHAATNQPRNVRIQCPAGTRPQATPIGSAAGGVVHDGYRWICTY